MGWLIALGILVLMGILPLGISAQYNRNGLLVKLIAGPVRLQIFPAKKKTDQKESKKSELKKDRSHTPKANQTAVKQVLPTKKAEQSQQQTGGSVADFLPLVQLALDFLGDFTRKLRIDRLELNLILAGDDPCDLATNYGKAWVALGNLWPRFEEAFVIRKRQVEIQCDFEAVQPLVTARLDLSITLGRLLGLGLGYGVRALIQFIKITNKRKGGAAI